MERIKKIGTKRSNKSWSGNSELTYMLQWQMIFSPADNAGIGSRYRRSLIATSMSDSDDLGGGFVVNDRPKRHRKTGPYLIESDSDDNYNLADFVKVEETKPRKSRTRKNPAPRPKRAKVEKSADADFTPDLSHLEDDSDKSQVEVLEARPLTRNGELSQLAIDLESDFDDDLSLSNRIREQTSTPTEVEEEPEEKPKKPKKPRKPRQKKPAKPKIPYYTRVTNQLYEHHPELKDVFAHLETIGKQPPQRQEQPQGMTINLLPFQLEGLYWLINQEQGEFNGGVLADEMGMGKTIQTIALMMNDRQKRPNLVIGPTVALMQWKNEIEAHTDPGTLKVLLYHGANRSNNVEELLEYDVILTSYAVLELVYRKERYGFVRKNGKVKEKSALHAIPFYRVILDEAHNIKDRNTGTAKAAMGLQTEKRWCLSGTPLQNRISEMYSLIRFLRIEPFNKYFCYKCECSSSEWLFSNGRHCDHCGHSPMLHTNCFNHFMLKNIQKYGIEGDGATSFHHLRLLLDGIMLRRTKLERADDLGLPPRVVEIRKDFFNEEEKDLYQSLYSDLKRKFNDFVAEGVVLNNYANIFTLITRMRQIADHPDLVLKKVGGNQPQVEGVIMCQLCDDEAEEPIESKCHHRFCRLCVSDYCALFDGDESNLTCPVCHIGLSIDLEQPALLVDEELFAKALIVNRITQGVQGRQWRSLTKIEALVEELYKLRLDKHTIKLIVFSQFTSMLDLIEWRLKRAGFETVKLSGSMTPQQRDSTIKYFMNNSQVEVFLVSLKAGGVALNLCEASQVFLMDPWWNPSVEWQSMDRVHRIGQKRPIRITRFCIEDSIELKIIELQEKKATMIRATINSDEAAANRLTPDDLQFLFQ